MAKGSLWKKLMWAYSSRGIRVQDDSETTVSGRQSGWSGMLRDGLSIISTNQRENESSLRLYTSKAHLQWCIFSSKATLLKLPTKRHLLGIKRSSAWACGGTFLIQAITKVLYLELDSATQLCVCVMILWFRHNTNMYLPRKSHLPQRYK